MAVVESFFAMGGYGAYVWPSYLLAAAVLAGLYLASRCALKRRERSLQALEASRGGRPRRRGGAAS